MSQKCHKNVTLVSHFGPALNQETCISGIRYQQISNAGCCLGVLIWCLTCVSLRVSLASHLPLAVACLECCWPWAGARVLQVGAQEGLRRVQSRGQVACYIYVTFMLHSGPAVNQETCISGIRYQQISNAGCCLGVLIWRLTRVSLRVSLAFGCGLFGVLLALGWC